MLLLFLAAMFDAQCVQVLLTVTAQGAKEQLVLSLRSFRKLPKSLEFTGHIVRWLFHLLPWLILASLGWRKLRKLSVWQLLSMVSSFSAGLRVIDICL